MKKTIVSLAAAAALTTGAFAADKGIDIVTTGQAVIYYQTADKDVKDDKGFFDSENSKANVGIQLNLNADLKNNFTFGSQLTYLGTAGLENNLVDNVMQTNTSADQTINHDTTNDIMLTKIFVAKKVANTTVKIGRQELPKSLSPLAFSEGWNVFKNTFDAVLAVNTDLPNTTLVGAFVSKSNASNGDLAKFNDLTTTDMNVGKGAYMLTAQTTAIPMTTLTASYYHLSNVGHSSLVGSNDGNATIAADAIWIDAKITDKSLPMGLNIGLQYGNVNPDSNATLETKDTTAYGIKIGAKPMPALTVCAAYTDVDEGTVAVKNTGTGVKTPLYTQMILNQNYIARDASTYMLKASYSLADMGTVTAQYAATDDSNTGGAAKDDNDYNELDLVYTAKFGGVNYLAAYVMTDADKKDTDADYIRVWARYNF